MEWPGRGSMAARGSGCPCAPWCSPCPLVWTRSMSVGPVAVSSAWTVSGSGGVSAVSPQPARNREQISASGRSRFPVISSSLAGAAEAQAAGCCCGSQATAEGEPHESCVVGPVGRAECSATAEEHQVLVARVPRVTLGEIGSEIHYPLPGELMHVVYSPGVRGSLTNAARVARTGGVGGEQVSLPARSTAGVPLGLACPGEHVPLGLIGKEHAGALAVRVGGKPGDVRYGCVRSDVPQDGVTRPVVQVPAVGENCRDSGALPLR